MKQVFKTHKEQTAGINKDRGFPGGSAGPAMQKTWVRSLGWKDALEKGKATHSSILAWRIPWTRDCIVHGVAKSLTR